MRGFRRKHRMRRFAIGESIRFMRYHRRPRVARAALVRTPVKPRIA
jgi:hypothetical protein